MSTRKNATTNLGQGDDTLVGDRKRGGGGTRSHQKCPYPSLYFGGCCFGAAFYVGVYKALYELYGPDFMQDMKISGGSAGTIFAIGIALRKSPEYMDNLY